MAPAAPLAIRATGIRGPTTPREVCQSLASQGQSVFIDIWNTLWDCSVLGAPPAVTPPTAVPAPVATPAFAPDLKLKPNHGRPLDEVEATGSGFPPNKPVKLTWETPGGEDLGTAQSNGDGEIEITIVVPSHARPAIYTVYATSGSVTASASFAVERCINGLARIRLLSGLPLGHVLVELFGYEEATGSTYFAGFDITELDGSYEICSKDLTVHPDDLFYLKVSFAEVDPALPDTNRFGVVILDESTAKPERSGLAQSVYQISVGDGGDLGVSDPRYYFRANTGVDLSVDLVQDIWIYDVQDNPDTEELNEDHAFEAAIVYYHSFQAARFFAGQLGSPLPRSNKVNFNTVEIVTNGTPVWIYSGECSACANVSGIFYNDEGAVWNDGNAPRNREYHEMAHWLMLQEFGGLPHRLAEPPHLDFNGNNRIDIDVNHSEYARGYRNVLSSSDGWSEGFAEFMGMAIADYYDNIGLEPFWQDLLPPYIYTVGHPFPYMLNIEHNGVHKYEEFEVAALLWDLYDPVYTAEDDALQVPIRQIWELLSSTHILPTYFDVEGGEVYAFTGDEHTYPTDRNPADDVYPTHQADSCAAFSDPVAFPLEERHIYYVKDLYDVLSDALPSTDVSELFKAHRFFLNSYHLYTDYRQKPALIPIDDGAASVTAEFTSEAGHDFWGEGLALDLANRDWGAGILFDEPFDARGFGYLLMWVNTDRPMDLSLVLEDKNGEWLAPVTSKGMGWELLFMPLVKYPGGGLTLGFEPNPNRNTPPTEAELSLETIQRLGLVVNDVGSSQLDVGGVLFTRGYPWKPGVCQIIGMGDPAQAPFVPYRRDMPPLPGATAQIAVNEFPATLDVQVSYGPPYEELSFSYPVELSEQSTVIGLYIEPGAGDVENHLSLSVEKEGFVAPAPLTLSSSDYWEQLNPDEHVLSASFDLEPAGALTIPDDLAFAGDELESYVAYVSMEGTSEDGSSLWLAESELVFVRTDGPEEYNLELHIYSEEGGQLLELEAYLVGDLAAVLVDEEWEVGERTLYESQLGVEALLDRAEAEGLFLVRDLLRDPPPGLTWQVAEMESEDGIDLIRYEPAQPPEAGDIELIVADLWVAADGNYVAGFEFEAIDPSSEASIYYSYFLEDINADLSIEIPEEALLSQD